MHKWFTRKYSWVVEYDNFESIFPTYWNQEELIISSKKRKTMESRTSHWCAKVKGHHEVRVRCRSSRHGCVDARFRCLGWDWTYFLSPAPRWKFLAFQMLLYWRSENCMVTNLGYSVGDPVFPTGTVPGCPSLHLPYEVVHYRVTKWHLVSRVLGICFLFLNADNQDCLHTALC